MVRDEEGDRPLPHRIRRPSLTAREKSTQKHQATEMKALQTKGAKFRAVTKVVKTCHVVFGIIPFGRKCSSDMLRRRRRSPSKKSKKRWCERISCIIEGVYTIGLCISSFLSENSILRVKENWDQNTRQFLSKGSWHQNKIRERKGPSRGIIHECEPHERSLCAPKFG